MKRADVITIARDGSTVTTSGTSVALAIPVNQSGNRPLYIRVAATNESYVQMGGSTVAATANSVLIQPLTPPCLPWVVIRTSHISRVQAQAA